MTDWHPEDIKGLIRKRGRTLTSIGTESGITRQIMSKALVQPHLAAETAIATFLNVPAYTIWPSRYLKSGKRRSPQPSQNYAHKPRFHREGVPA